MIIQEDYVSFEIAKLLKEKGFDKFSYYGWDEQLFDKEHPRNFSIGIDDKKQWISCHTHQMAMKWLRGKDIRICPDYSDVDGKWFAMIGTKKKRTYSGYYDTYEEAVEAALKYSLENLI